MSNLLSVSTIILCIAGALYSAVYLWLNSFYRTAESPRKNVGILRIIKSSVIWSMVFAFLSCLLAGGGAAYAAVDRASALYRVIALTWLAVIIVCGALILFLLVTKKELKPDFVRSAGSLFKIAVTAFIVGAVLSWLLE